MNQRRVRVLPRSESRRGAYTAKPHLPGLGITDLNNQTSSNRTYWILDHSSEVKNADRIWASTPQNLASKRTYVSPD